jgi:hypothetical protein
MKVAELLILLLLINNNLKLAWISPDEKMRKTTAPNIIKIPEPIKNTFLQVCLALQTNELKSGNLCRRF